MCLICIEFDKSAMTIKEARRALGEMVVKIGTDHAKEVESKLTRAEEEEKSRPSGPPPSP